MKEYTISRRNWLESKEKWEKIVEYTKDGEPFYNNFGFKGLQVVAGCGYCHEFISMCYECPLGEKRLCNKAKVIGGEFWKYIDLMKESKHKKALPHAEKILAAILEDEERVR